jgi:hypothetical protein
MPQAVVPGASITIKNEGTGATRSLITNDQGPFATTLLPVGSYEVTVEKAKLQKRRRRHNDPVVPNGSAAAATGSFYGSAPGINAVSVDAVEEFRVITSSARPNSAAIPPGRST